jgi:hypothetical protein
VKQKLQLTPLQQQIYTDIQQINAHITNINTYIQLGHLDHALHTYHMMLNIYERLCDQPIPFLGKEILYEKVKKMREKISAAFRQL